MDKEKEKLRRELRKAKKRIRELKQDADNRRTFVPDSSPRTASEKSKESYIRFDEI